MRTGLLMVAFGLLSASASAQQKLPTAAEVMGKLKEKRDSGGVWKYKLEFETTGFANGQVNGTCRSAYEFLVDWKTGTFREDGWDGCDSEPFEILKVYDGQQTKTKFRSVTSDRKPIGDGSWKYGFSTGRMNSGTYQAPWWPVFFHKGVIAGGNDGFYPGHFVFDPDADKFFIHGEILKGGQKCISLKTFPENPIGLMQYTLMWLPRSNRVTGLRAGGLIRGSTVRAGRKW
jgi:hypothetical protein